MYKVASICVAIAAVVLGGCGTVGTAVGPSERPLYYGYGSGTTATRALNEAKRDVLSQVVADLLDATTRAAKSDQLAELFYETEQPNGFFYLDTLETVSQRREAEIFAYTISVRVNLAAVVRTLRGNDIYGGLVPPGSMTPVELPDKSAPRADSARTSGIGAASEEETASAPSAAGSAVDGALASTEDREVVEKYLDGLTFLVYFNDAADEDPFLMKAAVSIANRYLAEEGIYLIDLEIVETIKKDQELAYEAQSGQAISLIQWIAQKLNADIYVEIDAQTTGETSDGRYYGQANITLEFFESSTASLLASVPYRSPRTFSSSSELDALNNAIQSSVYQAMPVALEQVYDRMRKMAQSGISYELVILQTPDGRLMRDFMKRLELRAEKVEIVSQSPEETRYRVYLVGEISDLQDIVFDIADLIPALRGLELVYLRGKSITFSSGL
jgi:hypothetical protein